MTVPEKELTDLASTLVTSALIINTLDNLIGGGVPITDVVFELFLDSHLLLARKAREQLALIHAAPDDQDLLRMRINALEDQCVESAQRAKKRAIEIVQERF